MNSTGDIFGAILLASLIFIGIWACFNAEDKSKKKVNPDEKTKNQGGHGQ